MVLVKRCLPCKSEEMLFIVVTVDLMLVGVDI